MWKADKQIARLVAAVVGQEDAVPARLLQAAEEFETCWFGDKAFLMELRMAAIMGAANLVTRLLAKPAVEGRREILRQLRILALELIPIHATSSDEPEVWRAELQRRIENNLFFSEDGTVIEWKNRTFLRKKKSEALWLTA